VPAGATIEVPSAPSQIPPVDIDELIARLDRISVEIFKRSPKELGNAPESEGNPAATDEAASDATTDSTSDP